MALKIIFRPLEPTKYLCFGPYQGLFLKRQKEVSETFSRVICVEIVHVKAIWDAILKGPNSRNFYAILRAHTLIFVEKFIGEIKPIAIAAIGARQFAEMKETIATMVMEKIPTIIDQSYEYTNQAMDIETTMRTRMKALQPAEFEGKVSGLGNEMHSSYPGNSVLLALLTHTLHKHNGLLQVYCTLLFKKMKFF